MSLSELQGLGLLFQEGFNEITFGSSPIIDENYEMGMNPITTANLFKHSPRSSKPLHENEIPDFHGYEYDEYNNNNKRRDSKEDIPYIFEPYRLSKKERISRIEAKLNERPTVSEMKSRGLLYEHPAISKSLILRKKELMRRRASNKVNSMLSSRPNRRELQNKNILLSEDDSLEKRKRHKRKRSQDLENAIQRRPIPMEEKEAMRQKRKSLIDSNYRPDYLPNIIGDDNDIDNDDDMQQFQVDIRFLNIGGMVIPFVSPSFMNELAGVSGHDPIERKQQINDIEDIANLEEKIEDLEEKIDDFEEQIEHQIATINSKKK
eukprot:172123_1